MPRLIRRKPLAQRLQDYFNIWDWLLWVSEELESNDWDEWAREYAFYVGCGLNFVFLLARASCDPASSRKHDDVFGDYEGSGTTGWLTWFAYFITHTLALFSTLNALYTFLRKRHYRLFENPIDDVPSTPSAHRARVDSSPVSSSPLRLLSSIITSPAAVSRAHPDPTRDVWELAVWDPLPICLRLFCLFSPLHVLIYWFYLPVAASDPRPSVTVFTSILLSAALSLQLTLFRSYTSQQAKDSTIIHKEVLNEYDIKFVHPRTRPEYRDISTQFDDEADEEFNSVDTYRPTTIINRGFKTNPNPNYTKQFDPDGISAKRNQPPSRRSSLGITSPALAPQQIPQAVLRTPAHLRDASSPLRPNTALRHPLPQPHPQSHQPSFRSSGIGFPLSSGGGSASGTGDGGSMGIYSNARSPLRKSASTSFDPKAYGERETSASPEKRASSPLKRGSMPAGAAVGTKSVNPLDRFGHLRERGGRRESGRF